MLPGTDFEEFGLAFTATVRRENALILIPLYYLLSTYVAENVNASWNSYEEKLQFFASL